MPAVSKVSTSRCGFRPSAQRHRKAKKRGGGRNRGRWGRSTRPRRAARAKEHRTYGKCRSRRWPAFVAQGMFSAGRGRRPAPPYWRRPHGAPGPVGRAPIACTSDTAWTAEYAGRSSVAEQAAGPPGCRCAGPGSTAAAWSARPGPASRFSSIAMAQREAPPSSRTGGKLGSPMLGASGISSVSSTRLAENSASLPKQEPGKPTFARSAGPRGGPSAW